MNGLAKILRLIRKIVLPYDVERGTEEAKADTFGLYRIRISISSSAKAVGRKSRSFKNYTSSQLADLRFLCARSIDQRDDIYIGEYWPQ
jgi:hypothetical protein